MEKVTIGSASFPSYLLSYSDEELEEYINQELEKQRQEEEQKKKKLEKTIGRTG